MTVVDGYTSATYGDAFADVYDDWYGDLADRDATITTVAALTPAGGRVLELGVGTGRLADPAGRGAARARRHRHRRRHQRGDARTARPPNDVDGVVDAASSATWSTACRTVRSTSCSRRTTRCSTCSTRTTRRAASPASPHGSCATGVLLDRGVRPRRRRTRRRPRQRALDAHRRGRAQRVTCHAGPARRGAVHLDHRGRRRASAAVGDPLVDAGSARRHGPARRTRSGRSMGVVPRRSRSPSAVLVTSARTSRPGRQRGGERSE